MLTKILLLLFAVAALSEARFGRGRAGQGQGQGHGQVHGQGQAWGQAWGRWGGADNRPICKCDDLEKCKQEGEEQRKAHKAARDECKQQCDESNPVTSLDLDKVMECKDSGVEEGRSMAEAFRECIRAELPKRCDDGSGVSEVEEGGDGEEDGGGGRRGPGGQWRGWRPRWASMKAFRRGPMGGPMGGPMEGFSGGPMGGPMGGFRGGPMGGPMGGFNGGPMMGGPMRGPTGGPMEGFHGGPMGGMEGFSGAPMQGPTKVFSGRPMGGPMERFSGGPMGRPTEGFRGGPMREHMGGHIWGHKGGPRRGTRGRPRWGGGPHGHLLNRTAHQDLLEHKQCTMTCMWNSRPRRDPERGGCKSMRACRMAKTSTRVEGRAAMEKCASKRPDKKKMMAKIVEKCNCSVAAGLTLKNGVTCETMTSGGGRGPGQGHGWGHGRLVQWSIKDNRPICKCDDLDKCRQEREDKRKAHKAVRDQCKQQCEESNPVTSLDFDKLMDCKNKGMEEHKNMAEAFRECIRAELPKRCDNGSGVIEDKEIREGGEDGGRHRRGGGRQGQWRRGGPKWGPIGGLGRGPRGGPRWGPRWGPRAGPHGEPRWGGGHLGHPLNKTAHQDLLEHKQCMMTCMWSSRPRGDPERGVCKSRWACRMPKASTREEGRAAMVKCASKRPDRKKMMAKMVEKCNCAVAAGLTLKDGMTCDNLVKRMTSRGPFGRAKQVDETSEEEEEDEDEPPRDVDDE